MLLETIEVETAPKPDAAIIWLHGLGADGHDFEPVVPEIVRRRERAWRFVFPNAPVRPITINAGMSMPAWYDILGLDRNAPEDRTGFLSTDALVRELIAQEAARGIPIARMVLAGFSQGGAVTLYTGLRCRAICRSPTGSRASGRPPMPARRSSWHTVCPTRSSRSRGGWSRAIF